MKRSTSVGSIVSCCAFLLGAIAMFPGSDAIAQATVESIAGAPSSSAFDSFDGFVDGPFVGEISTGEGASNVPVAQFNNPSALALGLMGDRVYVADAGNDALRVLNLTDSKTETLVNLAAGSAPVDVKVDAAGDIYVLNQGSGKILKFNIHGNALATINGTDLVSPTAFAIDANNDFYVVESSGALKKVTTLTGVVTVIPVTGGALVTPRGIVVLDNGDLAVSDSGNHVVRIMTVAGAIQQTIGSVGTSGRVNGAATFARFNSPGKIAKAGADVLVLADTLNHRVVQIAADRTVTLLYGADPAQWQGLPSTILYLPGWDDGEGDVAWARNPEGITVIGNGDVYTSEVFYHNIRRVVDTGLQGPSGSVNFGSNGTNAVVNPPSVTMSPLSGYFPTGVDVEVASASTNVFYTTDGTEPTTNSVRVPMSNGKGTIRFFNSLADLRNLSVSAFLTVGSNTVSSNIVGTASPSNQVGVPRDFMAGPGATIVLPVIINLVPGQEIRSIGFKLAVRPDPGNMVPTAIPANELKFIGTSTNDFVPLVAPSTDGGAVTFFSGPEFFNAATMERSIDYAALGVTNFGVSDFAALALATVKIPNTAVVGDVFHVEVKNISGTSDGVQNDVSLSGLTARTITISDSLTYIAGNTAPGVWYNAGEFGDAGTFQSLKISDVNNAFLASQGIKKPFDFSDVFNAMDIAPSEAVGGTADGDGTINIEDWTLALNRVLGNDTNNFARRWSLGGTRVSQATASNGDANFAPNSVPLNLSPGLLGDVWTKHARLLVGAVSSPQNGDWIEVPITLDVFEGITLDAIAFTIAVEAEGNAPALNLVDTVSWVRSQNSPVLYERAIEQGVILGWYGAYSGTIELGKLRFRIPLEAEQGDCYRIGLRLPEISPTGDQLGFVESFSGCIKVNEENEESELRVSDEWLETFLSGYPDALRDLTKDADGDGQTNWQEYLAGTDPSDVLSNLGFSNSRLKDSEIKLRWISAPLKEYIIEATSDFSNGQWEEVDRVSGTGGVIDFPQDLSGGPRFYRIRIAE